MVGWRRENLEKERKTSKRKRKMSTLFLELPIELKSSSLDRFAQSNAHHPTPEGEASAHPGLHWSGAQFSSKPASETTTL
jgi:hypothetical protein